MASNVRAPEEDRGAKACQAEWAVLEAAGVAAAWVEDAAGIPLPNRNPQ